MPKRFMAYIPGSTPTPVADTTAPSVPTNVAVSSLTSSSFTVTWTASTDNVAVTGYTVQLNGATYGTTTGATTLAVSGRAASTAYAVRVQANDAAGNFSTLSTAVTATTSALATGGTPVNLFSAQTPSTTDATDNQGITLSTRFVSDVDGNVTGVRFYRAATAPTSAIGVLYSDAGVELARATYGTLTTGWNSVTFTTPVATTAGTYYRAAYWSSGPYVASNGFFASPVVNAHLTGTGGYYGYSATPASGTQQFNAGSYFADVSFVVTGTVAPATAPATPAAPSVSAGDTSLSVSWVAPANGGSAITGYDLQPFAGATSGAVTSVGNVTNTTLTGLANGTAYTVKLRAKNAVGNSPYSAASAAATPAAPSAGSVTHGYQITAANTGHTAYTDSSLGRTVTDADLTVHTGLVSLSDFVGNGGTITKRWFKGGLIIDRDDVTMTACKFDSGISGFWAGVHHRFTANWCTVDTPTGVGDDAIHYQDYTAYRCRLGGNSDGAKINGNATLTECFIRTEMASADDHNDGLQSVGGYAGNSVIRCNIDCRPTNGIIPGGSGGPTTAILVGDGASGLQVWTDNFLAGGGYLVRCYENSTYNVQGNWFLNNSWIYGPATRDVIPQSNLTWGTVRPNLLVDSAGTQLSVVAAP